MGYPMTYKRVVGRNRLDDGNWHSSGSGVAWRSIDDYTVGEAIGLAQTLLMGWNDAAKRHNQRVAMLLDDMDRLRRDTLDEGSVCELIAQRTGVDAEVVAAVLKEWLDA